MPCVAVRGSVGLFCTLKSVVFSPIGAGFQLGSSFCRLGRPTFVPMPIAFRYVVNCGVLEFVYD